MKFFSNALGIVCYVLRSPSPSLSQFPRARDLGVEEGRCRVSYNLHPEVSTFYGLASGDSPCSGALNWHSLVDLIAIMIVRLRTRQINAAIY